MVEARCALTMVSRYESKACKTEMGRLSVVFGLSMRVRPVIFMACGKIRVVRVRGMSCWRQSVQSGWRHARTLRVKPWKRDLDGTYWVVSIIFGRAAEKDVVLVFRSEMK